MKNIILSFSLCLCVGFAAVAQDTEAPDPAYTSKRGVELLPQMGDFALGIDATPFLNYLGNFFNRSGNSAPVFEGVNQMIYGKYFLQNDRALRVRLSLNLSNNAEKGVVTNLEEVANNPLNPNASVIDVMNVNRANVGLGVGYEFRRGKGRVQGFYGGEVFLGFENEKYKYDYANPMTALNHQDWNLSYNFNGNWYSSRRMTEMKSGNIFYGGLGAFVGVEYFFAPQMSIGGEMGLGLYYRAEGQSESTWESWNTSADKLQTQTDRWGKGQWEAQNAKFYTKTYGSIFLMFHF